MPVLRSAKSKKLSPPLQREKMFRSMHNLSIKNISRISVKPEPKSNQSSTEISDVKKFLQLAPYEAKLYSDLCEEELKKLMKERELLQQKLQELIDSNKKRDSQDSEPARIVQKLWEEANKKGKMKSKCSLRKLGPNEVSKVFDDTKRISNHLKLRRKLLLAKKQRLESKIHLALNTIKFCRKFSVNKK